MIELLGKSLEELQSIFKTHNIQKFRAKQLIDYIYHRYIFDFEDMTQFPKDLRQWLGDNCVISLPTLITESIAPDGKTRKILVEMSDQKSCGSSFDGATLWVFCMCFLSSGVCYGMCILCFYTRWLIQRFNSR